MTERTRIQYDETASHSFRYLWTPLSGSPGVVDEMQSFPKYDRFREMVDVVTPGFSKLQNHGVIINNPLWLEDIDSTTTPQINEALWWFNGIPGRTIWPMLDPLVIPNASRRLPDKELFESFFEPFESYKALANNRAWSNVELSETLILASLGELPETLSWFRSLLERSVRLVKMFHSKTSIYKNFPDLIKTFMGTPPNRLKRYVARQPKKVIDKIGGFADAWLEFRYAIRPLVFEMKACISALQKIIKTGTRQTARGKEVNLVNTSSVINHSLITYGAVTVTEMRQVVKATYSCRAGVLFEIEDDLNTLMAIWGVDQPLESIYELVPFSFIADWFFSIGETISAWSVNSSLRPLSTWSTFSMTHHEVRETLSINMTGRNGYTFKVMNVIPGKTELKYQRKWRTPYAERFLLPRFDLKLDLAKIIDLGTIGRSLLSGKSPKYKKGA